MARALALAQRAAGRTAPNPAVGAVVVSRGVVAGEGYHRQAGLSHAEVEALRRAGDRARGGTLYVTLEPCNHTGRTPPCCDAILASGIARVVVATRDPNPITNGRGIARLRRAGVVVRSGVLARESAALNEPFFHAMTHGLPLVIAKLGQSLDGKIATRTGESQWITSAAARRMAHRWRGRVDAVLVGITTVLRDDPLLTARGVRRRPHRPIKVIVDSRLRIPLNARCLSRRSPTPAIVATTIRRGSKRRALMRLGVEVVTFPARQGRVPLASLCRWLVGRGVHSVLLEGGGEVMASALAERLVNRVVFFLAPILIGGDQAPGAVGGPGAARLSQAARLADVRCTWAGPDLCVEARVVYPRTGAR